MAGIPRARTKDRTWSISGEITGDDRLTVTDSDEVKKALLMDLRDEAKALNRVMQCQNVMAGFVALQNIERTLKRIDRRLAKKIKLP